MTANPLRPLLIFLISFVVSLSAAETPPEARNTIFWISLDGFRHDYTENAETPFLDRIRAESAWSDDVWPVFPSVTFSTHVSIATGTLPEIHGITGNIFYDTDTGELHRYPHDSRLLQAEPIWITAERQGIRTAVLDWVLSHAQTGPVTTSYFGEKFDGSATDPERLNRILDVWENDDGEKPLQLILGYTTSPDREGHQHGPDSAEVATAVEQIDKLLEKSFERAVGIWETKKTSPADQLFLILTSDHGMLSAHTVVHPEKLADIEGSETAQIVTTGNVGHLFLQRDLNEKERTEELDRIHKTIAANDFATAWRRDEIPETWGLRHPTRTGDLLVVLDEGYTFNRLAPQVAVSLEGTGRTLGMHGYDPANVPAMRTPLFIFRYPQPLGEHRLGKVHSLQLHATVADILGIKPAEKAHKQPIQWNRSNLDQTR